MGRGESSNRTILVDFAMRRSRNAPLEPEIKSAVELSEEIEKYAMKHASLIEAYRTMSEDAKVRMPSKVMMKMLGIKGLTTDEEQDLYEFLRLTSSGTNTEDYSRDKAIIVGNIALWNHFLTVGKRNKFANGEADVKESRSFVRVLLFSNSHVGSLIGSVMRINRAKVGFKFDEASALEEAVIGALETLKDLSREAIKLKKGLELGEDIHLFSRKSSGSSLAGYATPEELPDGVRSRGLTKFIKENVESLQYDWTAGEDCFFTVEDDKALISRALSEAEYDYDLDFSYPTRIKNDGSYAETIVYPSTITDAQVRGLGKFLRGEGEVTLAQVKRREWEPVYITDVDPDVLDRLRTVYNKTRKSLEKDPSLAAVIVNDESESHIDPIYSVAAVIAAKELNRQLKVVTVRYPDFCSD